MANAETQYQDFEPSTEWIEEGGSRTLIVYLPGFKKEQLKVQVTSTGALKISGERGVAGQKWSRFRHECSIPSDCEMSAISAKFQEGMLYVKLPKKTISPQEIEEVKAAAAAATTSTDEKTSDHQEHTTDHHPQTNDLKTKEKETEKTSEEKVCEAEKRVDAWKYKKSAVELVKGLKKPNKVINLVVAVLLATVLLLYVKNAIMSLGKPQNATH